MIRHLSRRAKRAFRTNNRFLIYCMIFLAFLICWSLLTILILVAQDRLLGPLSDEDPRSKVDPNSYMGKGIQMVVGHYNGNLPAEKLANLTEDELNANNFNPIQTYGENGRAVNLKIKDELESEKTFGINQFNLWISDRLPLNRTLPDIRKPACQNKTYPHPSTLPTTSVIIVYHNEAYSTLLRTVISVINRSPKEVLEEIILVDDFSTRTFLKKPLDDALKNLSVKIKIIRAKERVGLIRARLMGAAEAEGEVLTFLDSHCECTQGWLEPLLSRIKENRKAVVCPIIDVINDRTFAYQRGIEMFYGGFSWSLQFRWYAVSPKTAKERIKDATAPISSPAMAGGLFSIDRKYFEEIGTYDPGMDIWGGENIEISFRIWQCGGRVEILPCSHVGHIFRKASPHDFPNGKTSGNILNSNLVRVAEVWMDEWKHLFYKTAPQAYTLSKTIDVSERVELRKKLQCKSFDWYLKNVWPEHFLPTPESVFGRLKFGKQCLQMAANTITGVGKQPIISSLECVTLNKTSFLNGTVHREIAHGGGKSPSSSGKIRQCLGSRPGEVGKRQHRLTFSQCTMGFDMWQLWIFTPDGQIKGDEHQCLSATSIGLTGGKNWMVQLKECGQHDMEFWDYDSSSQIFIHRKSGLCLDEPSTELSKKIANSQGILVLNQKNGKSSTPNRVPSLQKCVRSKKSQKWHISPVEWLPSELIA